LGKDERQSLSGGLGRWNLSRDLVRLSQPALPQRSQHSRPSLTATPSLPRTARPIPLYQVFFAATGVSDSDLVKGVRYYAGGASTSSIVMRARSGTVRYIETNHRREGGGRMGGGVGDDCQVSDAARR
jgi:hypothetical protein